MAAILKERALAKLRKATIGEDGLPVMSPMALKLACMEHDGYETPELNEKLFLHFKGYRFIDNLAPYVALKTLFLESNGIQEISGLETCVHLRSLYLQQNGISKIEGLSTLAHLKTINLSQNRIAVVENLSGLKVLETLNLNKNCLNGPTALRGLLECPTITNLDLTTNELEEPEILEEILQKMPKLSCVYLKGNGLVRKIKSYRKTMITSLSRLAYLDDRPIFELERVAAEAWKEGGREAEVEARQSYNQKKKDQERQQRVNFKKWKAERRQKRQDEIAKAKAEGRELPPPRCFVRYSTVSKEDLAKDKQEQQRLDAAERRALRDPANGMAGESTATIQNYGRQFAEDCGAKFDENGDMIEPGKSDDGPTMARAARGDLGIVKKDHAFAEGYMDIDEEVEAAEIFAGETKQSSKATASASVIPSTFAPPAPAPLAAPVAPAAPAAPVAPSAPTSAALPAPPTQPKPEPVPEDPLDKERRQAVVDSMAIYRERSKAKKIANTEGPSMDLNATDTTEHSLAAPSREMDAMHLLNLEYKSMTTSQQTLLKERIQEAEEEEDNYRNERAKMKAMGSAATSRRATAAREEPEEEEEATGLWNTTFDERVQELTRQHLFDFETVARDMGSAFNKNDCRLRFALLSSNGGVAPVVAKTKEKRSTSRGNGRSSASSNSVRPTAKDMYRSRGASKRTSAPTAATEPYTPSTYTPWSPSATPSSNAPAYPQRSSTDLASPTATTTVTSPPPSTNDAVFNSKVMRIKPVTVNLDALPSMMDDSDEDDSDSDNGNASNTMTTDVDAMD